MCNTCVCNKKIEKYVHGYFQLFLSTSLLCFLHLSTLLSRHHLLPYLSFTHPNALFCIILVLGPSMPARCLFMDCTNDRTTRGEGSQWLMKWGRIIKQNSLHLEKLVLCSSLLLCSFTLVKTTRRTAKSEASMCILIAALIAGSQMTTKRLWLQCGWVSLAKRRVSSLTESLLTGQRPPSCPLCHVICIKKMMIKSAAACHATCLCDICISYLSSKLRRQCSDTRAKATQEQKQRVDTRVHCSIL